MTGFKSPTVRHRRLGRELRIYRERAGLTTEAASARLGWSRTKLVRFEAARTRPKPSDVSDALDLYGATLAERAELIELAKQARQRGWWSAYSDVFQSSYVALEDEAAAIRAWQPHFVPGVLQTEAYAYSIIKAGAFDQEEAILERRLQARSARKALLTRPSAPELHLVLDEAVIRRGPTAPHVMQEQLTALVSANKRPNITLQVLPFSTGVHAGLGGSLVLLEYSDPDDPAIAYIESHGGELYVESTREVDRLQRRFGLICDAALPPGESVDLIAAAVEEYA
ncbi:helix-turn-helix domain-containing protein [Actinomadura hibisca]|uniref:helix-turn-helix domain-containing protein n=1 Tax=Actinomadura hibisca TaxID=68565 RepID=UPI000836864C|nr:helix-turn-helix transcriptional regulator [Actinomadura hibisca]